MVYGWSHCETEAAASLDPATLALILALGRVTERGTIGLRARNLGTKMWRLLISSVLRLQGTHVVFAGSNADFSMTVDPDALDHFQ
jgi:hypothetical protein